MKNLYFRNGERDSEKIIHFLDNAISIGCRKFSLLRREYLSPDLNVLAKCDGIPHITKRDIFKVSFALIDEEISQKCPHEDT